jgi:hypothetical protein
MTPAEARNLRVGAIRATQQQIADQIVSPNTGEPVSGAWICRMERGQRSVPLWMARRLRRLAELARKHDLGEGSPR